jgi:hypothetical protein
MNKKLILVLVLTTSFVLTGCVERKLYVRTDPPGATLYFNGEERGQTPLSFDFEWYWWHKIRLEKEGYKPVEKKELIKAPPYMWIPLDFFVEILPFKVRDYHYLDYKLEKITKESQEKISKTKQEN